MLPILAPAPLPPALAPVPALIELAPQPALGGLFDAIPARLEALPELAPLRPLEAAPAPAPRPRFRGAAAIPHAITFLNQASGIASIVAAGHGSIGTAAGLILLGNLFDMLDGRVARALGVAGDMGVELDSQADVVTFGAAPAVLIYQAALHSWGPAGFAISAAYAAAGAYRLARFNLMALGKKQASPRPPDTFLGMPIPGGAGLLAGAALAFSGGSPLAAAGLTMAAAAAMASTVPYPAFKKGGLKKLAVPAAAAAAFVAGAAALGGLRWAPLGVFSLFVLSGPLLLLLRRLRR